MGYLYTTICVQGTYYQWGQEVEKDPSFLGFLWHLSFRLHLKTKSVLKLSSRFNSVSLIKVACNNVAIVVVIIVCGMWDSTQSLCTELYLENTM